MHMKIKKKQILKLVNIIQIKIYEPGLDLETFLASHKIY